MFRCLCPRAYRILQINHSIPRASLTKSRGWALGFSSLKRKYVYISFFLKEEGVGRMCFFPFLSMNSEREETGREEGNENWSRRAGSVPHGSTSLWTCSKVVKGVVAKLAACANCALLVTDTGRTWNNRGRGKIRLIVNAAMRSSFLVFFFTPVDEGDSKVCKY